MSKVKDEYGFKESIELLKNYLKNNIQVINILNIQTAHIDNSVTHMEEQLKDIMDDKEILENEKMDILVRQSTSAVLSAFILNKADENQEEFGLLYANLVKNWCQAFDHEEIERIAMSIIAVLDSKKSVLDLINLTRQLLIASERVGRYRDVHITASREYMQSLDIAIEKKDNI